MILTIFLWLLLAVLVVLTLGMFLSYKDDRKKDKNSSDTKTGLVFLIVFAVLSLILFAFLVSPSSSDDKKSSEPKTEKKATKKTPKKEKSKKESDKEKADKKEKAEVAALRKKNMAKNLEDYKDELSQASAKTDGAIADAYISKENGETIVVLSDDALDLNDNQLQAVSHSAWNAIDRMQDNYRIKENEDAHGAELIEIQDSAGDTIATTSFMGDFKYKGMK